MKTDKDEAKLATRRIYIYIYRNRMRFIGRHFCCISQTQAVNFLKMLGLGAAEQQAYPQQETDMCSFQLRRFFSF